MSAAFKKPFVRSKDLMKLGILNQSDFKDMNKKFKKSKDFKKAPSGNAVVKAKHKSESNYTPK